MVTDETYQNRYSYTGLGDYEVSFAYDITDNLIVEWISDAGVLEEKVAGVDYNITSSGAVVSCTVILNFGTGGDIIIRREMPLTQTWRGVDGTTPAPTGIMQAMDRLAWIVQQINGLIKNAIKSPANESLDMTIPTVVERAERVLGFDSTGRPVTVTELPEVNVTPWAETLLDDTSASEGRETLGVGMDRHVITTNTTLEVNKSYLINADVELSLPATPSVGDVIDIFSDGYPKIVQNDLQHSITYKGKYQTTKGTSGFIQMLDKERLQLTYKGSGLSYVESLSVILPSTQPVGAVQDVAFSPDCVYMAVGSSSSTYLYIYKRSGDVFTKLTDPVVMPTNTVNSITFSLDGTYLAIAGSILGILIYKRTGDTFVKLTPVNAPVEDCYSIHFSYDVRYLVVGHTTWPSLSILSRVGDVWTNNVSTDISPVDINFAVAFSYDGNYLASSTQTTNEVITYKKVGEYDFKKLTTLTLPALMRGCSFSFDGRYFAAVHATTPFVTIYKRNEDVFLKLADPDDLPTGTAYDVSFSYDGNFLHVAHDTSPFMTVYRRVGDIFVKLTNPGTLPSGIGRGSAFSMDGTYLATGSAVTPRYVSVYKMKEAVTKQWIATDFEVMNPDTPSADGDLKYRFK